MTIKKPNVFISNIKFFNGNSEQTFNEDDKVVIVGPNNSGKSQFLRDIFEILRVHNDRTGTVVKEVRLTKSVSQEVFSNYIKSIAVLKSEFYYIDDWSIHQSHLSRWGEGNYLGDSLAQGFIKKIAADDRLNICQQQDSISPGEQKTKPQHLLYDDGELMDRVSSLFYQAFNKQLMFDFRGGKKLPIHVGEIPEGIQDRVSNAYVEAVRSQPLLDEQGDGMKSYAGILFESVVANKDMTLLDEPEAFLHPPQMRRLGETLATEVKGQLFMATHSSDVLRGFLEGTKGKVRILRIQREGESNTIHEAPAEVLRELWTRPNLRYSNALDGIFYEQTIICEDDSDCRLIHAVADHLELQTGTAWKDTAYVPAGGKHAIPQIAQVLRQIGVPVKAVFDLDFLNEESMVRNAVEAFGGDWDEIRQNWQVVNAAVRDKNKPRSKAEIFNELKDVVARNDENSFTIKEASKVLKRQGAWHHIKELGKVAVPRGDATQHFNSLIQQLEKIGIYLVPVGELEGFSKDTGKHGPAFVTKLLDEKSLDDPSLQELRDFVEVVHQGEA